MKKKSEKVVYIHKDHEIELFKSKSGWKYKIDGELKEGFFSSLAQARKNSKEKIDRKVKNEITDKSMGYERYLECKIKQLEREKEVLMEAAKNVIKYYKKINYPSRAINVYEKLKQAIEKVEGDY